MQVIPYKVVLVSVTVLEPLVGSVSSAVPYLRMQRVAFDVDHESTDCCPTPTATGFAVNETVGGGTNDEYITMLPVPRSFASTLLTSIE
jgi:hypothetical protein